MVIATQASEISPGSSRVGPAREIHLRVELAPMVSSSISPHLRHLLRSALESLQQSPKLLWSCIQAADLAWASFVL